MSTTTADPQQPQLPRHGGVVFRVDDELFFLPASIAIKVMPTPEMARVPGAPSELRGVALVDGDMIPVVQLGEPKNLARSGSSVASGFDSGAMLVCTILGECLGLVGLKIVATGSFVESETSETSETQGTHETRETHDTQENMAPGPAVMFAGAAAGEEPQLARPFDVADVIARVREGRWAV